jgi:hypothetical protein
MKRQLFTTLISFAGGVVCTVAAFGLFVDVRAQPSNDVVDTCANADGTLRLIQPFGSCAPGERRVRLREPELDKQEEKVEEQKQLLALEQRVKDLEERARTGRLLGSRVYAPFEVINEAGYRVFMVEEDRVAFHTAVGKIVARVVMSEHGGYFMAESATGPLQAVIGVSDKDANVLIQENDRRRIDLGTNRRGLFGLRVYEPGGKLVAGIGQGNAGDGVVTVNDAEGNQRAAMYVGSPSGGILDLFNVQGKVVASLFATQAGNGGMQLFNREGVTMVDAGVNEYNVGSVRAGPAGFHPGVTFLGMPGSFISGKPSQ